MIDWDKPIETMEGWPAKVISTDYKTVSQKLHLVQIERPHPNQEGRSFLGFYMEDGRPWETQHHIRNVKVKREGWVLIEPPIDSRVVFLGMLATKGIYPSEVEAIKAGDYYGAPPGTRPVRFEWEE